MAIFLVFTLEIVTALMYSNTAKVGDMLEDERIVGKDILLDHLLLVMIQHFIHAWISFLATGT